MKIQLSIVEMFTVRKSTKNAQQESIETVGWQQRPIKKIILDAVTNFAKNILPLSGSPTAKANHIYGNIS
jgi:hypothetical protein